MRPPLNGVRLKAQSCETGSSGNVSLGVEKARRGSRGGRGGRGKGGGGLVEEEREGGGRG